MSTIIKVRCLDQVLTFESTPVVASGGLEEDVLQVSFCSKWDGLTRTAVFWRSEDEAYHVPLDDKDSCTIPREVLQTEGTIYFGLFGVSSDGRQRTSEAMRYTIVKGAITDGTKPSDPTPDIYTDLLAKYQEMLETTKAIQAAEQAFERAQIAAREAFEEAMAQRQTQHETDVDEDQAAFEQAQVEARQAFEKSMQDAQAAFEKEVEEAIAAGLLPDNSVTTAKLVDGAVTAAKLAAGAVTAAKLADGAVGEKLPAEVVLFLSGVLRTKGGAEVPLEYAQVEAGCYTGTGTFGESNKVELSLPFVPDVLIIMARVEGTCLPTILFPKKMPMSPSVYFSATGSQTYMYRTCLVSSVEGTTVKWYAIRVDSITINAEAQLNGSGIAYHYVAIGNGGEYVYPYIYFTEYGQPRYAERGMTWEEYCASPCNTEGYYVSGGKVYRNASWTVKNVLPTDVITEGGAYTGQSA